MTARHLLYAARATARHDLHVVALCAAVRQLRQVEHDIEELQAERAATCARITELEELRACLQGEIARGH